MRVREGGAKTRTNIGAFVIDLIVKTATGARAAVGVATFVLGGSLLFRLSPYAEVKALLGGASLPEETITSPDQFAEILQALGAAGRQSYLQFQIWDVLNPILIGFGGAMLLGWLLKRGQRVSSTWRFVALLPVVLLAADLLENLLISIGIGAYPDRTAMGSVLPVVTAAKFAAAISTGVAVLVLAFMWLRDRVSGAHA